MTSNNPLDVELQEVDDESDQDSEHEKLMEAYRKLYLVVLERVERIRQRRNEAN